MQPNHGNYGLRGTAGDGGGGGGAGSSICIKDKVIDSDGSVTTIDTTIFASNSNSGQYGSSYLGVYSNTAYVEINSNKYESTHVDGTGAATTTNTLIAGNIL